MSIEKLVEELKNSNHKLELITAVLVAQNVAKGELGIEARGKMAEEYGTHSIEFFSNLTDSE